MKKLLLSMLLGMMTLGAAAQTMYADVNGDGVINITDVNYVIDLVLSGNYISVADVNSDGQVNISDLNVIIELILNPPMQIPEDVHIYGDTPGSEGSVSLVTDSIVVVTCLPGEEPQPGDIIVSGVTDNAPYGFLRHVESVQTSGGQCIMITTNASLEEVLPDGDYHLDIPLVLPGQESTLNAPHEAPSRMKFSTDFKGTIKIGWKGDVPNIDFDIWPFITPEQEKKKEEEVLNGAPDDYYPLQFIAKISPAIELTFDCKIKRARLDRVELGGSMEVKSELLMKATLEKEFKRVGVDGLRIPGSIDFDPVTVMAGPVPIVFTPKLYFYLGVDLKGELYMQLKVMSASASGSFSYVYTRNPDPVTGQKHNFYKDFETKILGDGDMEKLFQKWLAPKVGVKGSVKGVVSPFPNVSVYNANDIFCVSTPLSPWAKLEGNLSITLDANNSSELDYEDNVTLTGGADIGIAARFNLLGKKEVWEKDFTLFETELMEPFALTPRFDELRVTPDDDPIPATTPAIEFGTYMTKPYIQLFPDQDYGFAYGRKDEANRTANWTRVSLKEQYDPDFEGDLYKHQYIQTSIDPSTVEPGVTYRVSPYVQLFGNIIYKKGKDFTLDDATPCITIPVAEVDFGDVMIGTVHTKILEINNSAFPKTVTIEVTPPFSIAHDESSMTSLTVEVPGNACTPVTLMFTAFNEEDYIGTATFTSDAIEGGQCVVSLHGRGVTNVEPQHEWVDLGLPSGTLWATMNVGASEPEDYGDYFAWGETEPKEVYTWETYKWCNGSNNTLTKYCTSTSYGTVDGKTELDPEDDAAYMNWGPSWRMPTMEQKKELVSECTWTWTQQNGVNGRLVTGPNGNSIFLPAAGGRWDSAHNAAGSYGGYWSNSLDSSNSSYAGTMDFDSYNVHWYDTDVRYRGTSVRAVRVAPDEGQSLYVVQQSLDLGEVAVGETRMGELTIVNNTTTAKTLTATADAPFSFSEGESCVSSITVVVPANSSYSVTVMFTATTLGDYSGNITFQNSAFDGGQCVVPVQARAISKVDDHEGDYVDLGLPSGTLWATMNVGASSPEEYGDYFAWGETAPKDNYNWSTYKWCNDSYTSMTKYCTNSSYGADGFTDGKTELDPEDDAAYVNWGISWRMPTHEQQQELVEECTWTWTQQNGVNGHLVTGPNGNTIFLPAAGYRWDESLNGAGSDGYYWSRALDSGYSVDAHYLLFYFDYVYYWGYIRGSGLAVRAVCVL